MWVAGNKRHVFSHSLETRSPKSRCGQCWFLLGLGETSPAFLPTRSGSWPALTLLAPFQPLPVPPPLLPLSIPLVSFPSSLPLMANELAIHEADGESEVPGELLPDQLQPIHPCALETFCDF